MRQIIRKLHTGEAGNPGQFGRRTPEGDDITLGRPVPRLVAPALTISGIAGIGAGMALIGSTAGLLPAAVVLASAVAVGAGGIIVRRSPVQAAVTPELVAEYSEVVRLAPVVDIQSKAIRRERAAEFDKADRFAQELAGI